MKAWRNVFTILVIIAVGYLCYQKGFEAGRDYTAQLDSANPKKWVSKKWGYEITFPGQWENIKRNDPSIKTSGADVFCGSRRSASTAVFVSPVIGNEDMDTLSGEVLNQYRNFSQELQVVDKKDYTKNSTQYRTIIFELKDHTHYYTIIISSKIILAISSNCLTSEFEAFKKDFEDAVDTVKFL